MGTQHIKNTDFKYKGKIPEIPPIPEPFKWNAFFAVYYKDMDDEHKPLFTCISDVEANPNDGDLLASCLKSYEDHFRHEEALIANSATYSKSDLYQHINKHNSFLATARGLSTPVPQNWIDFAKNWLTSTSPILTSSTRTRCPSLFPTHMSGMNPSRSITPVSTRRSTGQRTGSLSTSRTRIINTRRGLLDQILETISLDPILRLVLVLH